MSKFRTDISADSPKVSGTTDSYKDNLEVDVLLIGSGFAGVYLLHRLRDELGFNVKIYEAGKDLGGIWHWNCYPGARVDTPIPIYELSFPSLWKDWNWSEKYPGWKELREYFDYIDKKLDIRKDVAFDSRVVDAQFDNKTMKWTVKTQDGRTAYCKYLIAALGFAAKRHFPEWKGLDDFKGQIFHSSFWPEEGLNVKGKRVAVIGTGATGVQIAQEVGQEAAHTCVFQRTPNLALPMRQRKLTKEEQDESKKGYEQLFKDRMKTFAGFSFDFMDKATFDDSEEERQRVYEDLWDKGGFHFWLATYKDMLFDAEANNQAYQFWLKKTRERIKDERKADIMAPKKAPHYWGTKRPSLEQCYYEVIDDPKNDIVDLKQTPVVEVKENGILTEDGKFREFDIIAIATGYDSVTGGMMNMGLKDSNGRELKDKWKDGTYTYLGMTCAGFPNFFFLYGAQGPTAFSNGPSCVELQGEWIIDAIKKATKEDIKYLNPTEEGEQYWRDKIAEIDNKSLFPLTDSWYNGQNIPGKPKEQLNWPGGFPLYQEETYAVLNEGFKNFKTEPPQA